MKTRNYKRTRNVNISQILGILFILIAIVLILKVLVPMVLGLVSMFITLTKLYIFLDLEFKFLGGCFFLVVFYHIFSAVGYWIIKLMDFGIELVKKDEMQRQNRIKKM